MVRVCPATVEHVRHLRLGVDGDEHQRTSRGYEGEAIESVQGISLHSTMPPDLPNAAVYRFIARKATR